MTIISRRCPFLLIVAIISSTEGRLVGNTPPDSTATTNDMPNDPINVDAIVQSKTSEIQDKAKMIENLIKEELHYKSEIKRMEMMLIDLNRHKHLRKSWKDRVDDTPRSSNAMRESSWIV